jgi:hypothetical protein
MQRKLSFVFAILVTTCVAVAAQERRSIVLEIKLPNGSTPQLRILEGETGTASLPDLGKYGFAPTFNGGVVVVEIFDLGNQQRLGEVRAAVGGAAVQSSTKPQFGIRVIRVVIQ